MDSVHALVLGFCMPPATGTAIAIVLLWCPVGFNYARVVLMRSWPAPPAPAPAPTLNSPPEL